MIKKPNSQLKNKSIKYKIAYIFVILFVFALFVGSFGGLMYLGKSCSTNIVSAEEISGSSTETTNSVILSVNWQFQMERYISQDNIVVTDNQPLYLNQPLIVRQTSNAPGIIYLDYYYYYQGVVTLSTYTISSSGSFYIPMATNVGNLTMYFDSFDFEYFTESISHVDIEYIWGTDEGISLSLFDKVGNFINYNIYPYRVDQLSGTWELNNYTHVSINQRYFVTPGFNYTAMFQQYYDLGHKNGYDDGFIDGEEYGYWRGYAKGNLNAEYTWSSLLDAVFYAPMKAFVSLFNFELMGINVLSIASFILTVCIVVGILKWVL